ncbi:MAG: flavodoxin [Myxococcales bacterium]|nr:flavodoxin [Myxococcales bacterium]
MASESLQGSAIATGERNMSEIGIFFGSTTGNTTDVAELIANELGDKSAEPVDIEKASPEDFDKYSVLILGIPTWNVGQMQDDWDKFLPQLAESNWAGKTVALFGCGDQEGYPDTFGDALYLLWEQIQPLGPRLIGQWPTEGYSFEDSKAVVDGKFIGLMTDAENQEGLTQERVQAWVQELVKSL